MDDNGAAGRGGDGDDRQFGPGGPWRNRRDDGYSLIRQIRQREVEQGGLLPAVALTGYARAEDRAKTLAAGFHAHVPKPFDAAELTAAVVAAMRHPSHGSRR
ncbi:MAG: hypothetical protein DMF97_08235 [Acidobacteria bacterium]|nr:MAG: hypothetical protein DMF97_08235 [Acidobacteriota bacterium]